ncbi:flippase [archaeon AH-315-M20]|nr:flippase [archaeon AH-315-M20]
MKTARRITRNFLSLTASEIVSKILQLIIFVYLARTFGNIDFGKFGFAIAFSAIIVIIADLGLSTLLTREISRNRDKVEKYISNALTIKIFLSALTLVAAFLYLNFLNYTGDIKTVTYIMVLFMVLNSFTDLFYSVFRAFEKMYYDAFIKVLRMILLTSFIFIAIINSANLIVVTLMFPLTELIVLVVSAIIYIKNFARLSIGFDVRFSKALLKKSSFFCLSLIFISLLLYIDTVMLQKIRGSGEVGIYVAAYNILIGITFIPLMYSHAIFPVFSRYFISNKSLLKFAYKKSFQYMLILGLPITIGIYIYARNIILLIYGPGYGQSLIALKILCWFVGIRFVGIMSGTLLTSINRQGSRVFSQGTVTLINIILNLLLIPKFGFIGAGIATVTSEIFFLILSFYFIIKYKMGFNFLRVSAKPLIASIIMALIIINIPSLLLGTMVGIISYFGTLIIIRTFKKEDKDLLIRVMKNY